MRVSPSVSPGVAVHAVHEVVVRVERGTDGHLEAAACRGLRRSGNGVQHSERLFVFSIGVGEHMVLVLTPDQQCHDD
eukprot:CAMPEP_0198696050 /NCGR_PEP_ID=MMETSP1468-20131203/298762_1 /TAXON_ID=1461545 /ORGANISM="Mantoniella sp, Strain CCMP1436" /LENGTH=76 /DNA_ID=CAMNT_0044452075 /DNA_START=62 /DNA_END=293 /DNA_ORIENTATION=+